MEYKAFDTDEQRELTVNFVRGQLTDDLVVSSLARVLTDTVGFDDYTKNLTELQTMGDRLVHMLVGNPSPEQVDKLLVASAPQLMHLVLCAYLAEKKSRDANTPTLIAKEQLPNLNYIMWLVLQRLTIELFKATGEIIGDYSQNLPKERIDFDRLRNYRKEHPITPIRRFKPSMLSNFSGYRSMLSTRKNTPGFPEKIEETLQEPIEEPTNYRNETIEENLPNHGREDDTQG